MALHNFNGNVFVAQKSRIIYQKSFGLRNFETKERLDNNSGFELGSIAKQFTAMGILLLEQKEKLKLTDSLRKFFPELPYTNISLRQMLTHTSGPPDYIDLMMAQCDGAK